MIEKRLRIIGPQAGESEARFRFSQGDWDVLTDFRTFAGSLRRNSLVTAGVPVSLSVHFSDGRLEIDSAVPDLESVDAMLMPLRPFLLQDEAAYFSKVKNLLAKSSENPHLRAHLASLQRCFTGERLQSLYVAGFVPADGERAHVLNSGETLNLWLNGEKFHKDRTKRQDLSKIETAFNGNVLTPHLLFLVREKVEAILALADLLDLLFEGRESLQAHVDLGPTRDYLGFRMAEVATLSLLELTEAGDPLPEAGAVFEAVIDLTSLGPCRGTVQVLHPIGQLWQRGRIDHALGMHSALFRLAPGSALNENLRSAGGFDLAVVYRVQGFVVESASSIIRRDPAGHLLREMLGEVPRATSVPMKQFDSEDEVKRFLEASPRSKIQWNTAPRVAFDFAYWPLSERARARAHECIRAGQRPTFEQIEGSDLSQAWAEVAATEFAPGQ